MSSIKIVGHVEDEKADFVLAIFSSTLAAGVPLESVAWAVVVRFLLDGGGGAVSSAGLFLRNACRITTFQVGSCIILAFIRSAAAFVTDSAS